MWDEEIWHVVLLKYLIIKHFISIGSIWFLISYITLITFDSFVKNTLTLKSQAEKQL